MAKVGQKLSTGITVFTVPNSMSLTYLAKLSAPGEDGLAFAEQFVAEIKQQLAAGDRKFVIDLTNLTTIDSAGVGIVVGCRNMIVEAGGQVRAVIPANHVQEVLDLSRINSVLPLDASVDKALTALT